MINEPQWQEIRNDLTIIPAELELNLVQIDITKIVISGKVVRPIAQVTKDMKGARLTSDDRQGSSLMEPTRTKVAIAASVQKGIANLMVASRNKLMKP